MNEMERTWLLKDENGNPIKSRSRFVTLDDGTTVELSEIAPYFYRPKVHHPKENNEDELY